MKCACHGKEHRNLTLILPADRYVDIDPTPELPGRAVPVCDVWLREREDEREAQEKRRAERDGA